MNMQKGFIHIAIIAVIVLLVLAGGIWLYSSKFAQKQTGKIPAVSEISGTVDFNGVAPDNATIAIAEKSFDENDFHVVIENISASDHVKWSWPQAKSGNGYQIQGYLRSSDGKNIVSSDIMNVSAPAKEVVLSFEVVSKETVQAQAVISGTMDINGYIPPQSTLAVWVKKANEANFVLALDNLPVTDLSSWNWNQAIKGVSYEVKAVVSQNNKVIASSSPHLITAPATDEVLRVVSAVSPGKVVSGNGIISGKINFNGIAPAGSSIVIVARPNNTNPYKVVADGIPAQDGAGWSWSKAVTGTIYDLQAVLKVNGNDFAVSNTLNAAPPAFNEVFVLNSNVQQSQPPQSPFVTCNGQSAGLWAVNITFNYVSISGKQAVQYWVKLGDPSSDNRYLDSRIAAQNQSGQTQQSVTSPYSLGSGGTYYVKYAYSLNQNSGNLSDFSAWSNVTSITCPQAAPPTPTPTSAPIPTSTPVPTLIPTPTSVPTPTLPPYTSACNESCGGSGYTCVTGLQCSTAGDIGGNVCRNPNCTDKINCICL